MQAPLDRSVLYYLRVRQGVAGANSGYNLAVSFTDADGPQPDLVSVTVPSSVVEGEEFTVTISADNDGGSGTLGGPDSAINASVKYSDNTHDLSVSGPTASWAGVYKINYSPGQGPIFNFNSDNIGNAVDHLVEASDKSWEGGVRRSMSFKVTPQKPGTLLVWARVTMRSGARTNFLTDTTASGGSSSTDQQGWGVREYTVTVAPKPPPTGTITLTVRNGPDASFPVAANAVVIRRSTSDQYMDSQTTDANGRATFTVAADTAWNFEAFYVNPTFGNGGNNPPFTQGQPQPEFWGSLGSLTVGSGGNRTADLYRWTPIVKPSEVPGFDAVLVQRADTGAILAPGETVVAGTPLKFQVMVTNRSGITLDCSARLLLDRSRSGTFDQDLNSVLTPLGPGGLGGFVFAWTPQAADAGDYYSAPWAKVRLLNGSVWTSDSWSWSATPSIKVVASAPPKGITVITHGFQLSLLSFPEWTLFMARAISNRVGTASVGRYDKVAGNFLDDGTTTAIQPSAGESILVFDWASESDVPSTGWAEASGDALFAALVKFVGGVSRLGDYQWHFIGHSRGCVVNSEAVERLGALSVPVAHVTTLDPHDFDQGSVLGENAVPFDEHFKDWLLGQPQGGDDRTSWGVTTWDNVNYADNYFSFESSGFIPDGRELGSKAWQLNIGNYPPDISHSDVHAWYFGTLDLIASNDEGKDSIEIKPSWYPNGERTQRGWNLSRRGAGAGTRPDMDSKLKYAPIWSPLENGVFNGNFDHANNDVFLSHSVPGWEQHGGSGLQASVWRVGNNYLILSGQNAIAIHNRLVIPSNAGRVIFKVRAPSVATTLRVAAGDTVLGDVSLDGNGSLLETRELPIPANLRGTVNTLKFFVASGGASATVHIDDIAFGPETPAPAIITDKGSVNVPEGGTATVLVKLGAQPTGNVSVSVNRASGDSDITVQSGGTLTFTPSTWNVYQSVTLAAGEDVDTVNDVAVIRFSGTGAVSTDVTAVEIDNDALNILSSVSALFVPEGATASFMVRLNAQPPGNVTVSVVRVAGDPDISVQSGGSLTFTTGNWNVNQTVTLVAAEDVDTSNGSATVRLSAIGLPSTEVVAGELDNDSLPAGTLQFSQASYTVSEAAGSLSITVVRSGGSSGAVSVSYVTASGTATAPADFLSASGALAWLDGESASRSFSVVLVNDTLAEPTESFTIQLSSPTGGAGLGPQATATVTITDDDTDNFGLVAWWKFDEGSGTNIFDSSGNGVHGTITNGVWTTGRFGNALSFTSPGSVNFGDNDLLDARVPMTLSFWFKPTTAFGPGNPALVAYDKRTGPGVGLLIFLLGGDIQVHRDSLGEVDYHSAIFPAGQWIHFAVTIEDGRVAAYTNGALAVQWNISRPISANAEPAALLVEQGAIDEVRFHSRALSAAEVQALYGGPIVLNPANGHYYEYVPTQVTWPQARADAESRVLTNGWRGHLATVQDAAENEFVRALSPVAGTWLGGFQPETSNEPAGAWQWVTGEPLVYVNWRQSGGPVEPNNSGGNEDSMAMHGTIHGSPGTWNDANGISNTGGYVVEYEPPRVLLNASNGHYYEYVPVPVTWQQAKFEAESRVLTNGWRGHLVTMQDASENAFVTALVSNPNCWIGGFQPAGSVEPGGGWRWVTGEPFSYLNWLAGEPNEAGASNEDSILMDGANYFNPGKWSDLNGATATTGYVVEYEPQTLDNGLVARYAFDGNANDLGIFANHGTLNGGSFVAGIAGDALVFTGTSFVSVPSSASLKIAGTSITLAAWVFPTNYWAGGKSIVVRKMQHGGPTGGYLMGITETGRLTFGGVFGGFEEWQDTADAGTVPLNSWTHVAATYDGQFVRYYLNGVLVDTTPRTGALLADEQALAIGKITTSFFGELFYGKMDEVRLYNRTLGPADVAALHGLTPRWQLLPPFAPDAQDSVLFNGNGSVGQEDETQNVEAFNGFIYYVTHSDGTGSPSKIQRFDPATGSNIVVLAESSNQFWSLRTMRGALYISHLNGRLWRHDGVASTEVTTSPFAPANHVTSMAEFGGKMYFGTSTGRIYESADGTTFVERANIGGRIYALVEWKGHLYGANSEFYSYSAKIFRSSDGLNWSILSTNSVYSFHGFVAAPNHLYLVSVDNANGPSLAIRATTDGTTWTRIFYTTTEGKNMFGRSVFSQQTGRAYFGSEWAGVTRLIPVYEGQVESRFVTSHAFGSLVELDGRLFGLGGQSPANRGSSPYVISLLGNYTTSQAAAPAVTDQPKSLTVPAGASATFSVAVAGSEPFTYQWRRDSIAIVGATNATLTLAGVQSSQAGSYSVVVSNSSGSATSSNAVLTVLSAPTVQPNNPFPPPPHLLIGSTVTLTSQAAGFGLSYQWMFNGTNIIGAVGQTFTIPNATTAHAGRYTVNVSNLAGSVVEDVAALNFMGNLQMYSGILVTGNAGEQYQVRYANVLGGVTNWLVLTNFVHPGGEHLFIDRTSPGRDKRFYQVERYIPQ